MYKVELWISGYNEGQFSLSGVIAVASGEGNRMDMMTASCTMKVVVHTNGESRHK